MGATGDQPSVPTTPTRGEAGERSAPEGAAVRQSSVADRLHVVRHRHGTGPTVVVVHGGMDRSSSFGRVARHLGDVPLVRYDRRGYGRSRLLGAAPIERHVEDLLELVGEEDVVVFGHSLGGVIALLAAGRRPDRIRAVLAYEAPTPWVPWWPDRRPGGRAPDGGASGAGAPEGGPGDRPVDPADEAERFMRRMVGDRVWERLPARTRAERRAEGPALLADLTSLRRLAAPDLARLAVPVLSAAGSATTWWHRRAAEELARDLPHGELVVVDGAAHGVHLSHPAATADLVRRLRTLAAG